MTIQEKFSYKIPSPLVNRKNKSITRIGNSYFWLYRYIKGKISKNWNEGKLKSVAKMVTNYHRNLERFNLNNGKGKSDHVLISQNLNAIGNYVKALRKKGLKEWADKIYLSLSVEVSSIMKCLSSKNYLGLKQYYIHRDLGPENILFSGDKVVGVLDFDNVSLSNDILVKDLAIILQRAFTNDNGELNLKKASVFIEEYRKIKKLTNKEIELIPDLITASFVDDCN